VDRQKALKENGKNEFFAFGQPIFGKHGKLYGR